MFREELQEKLSKIFGFRKTTFDAPSDEYEQDTLFIEVQESFSRATNGKVLGKVTGSLVVYSQNNKLPYGFFAKRLTLADSALTRDLFLFDIDTDIASSPARIQNINERRSRFVYLFRTDFDPSHGEMTSMDVEQVVLDQVLTVNGEIQLDIGNGDVLEI
jgi:hypothetical protein